MLNSMVSQSKTRHFNKQKTLKSYNKIHKISSTHQKYRKIYIKKNIYKNALLYIRVENEITLVSKKKVSLQTIFRNKHERNI